VNEIIVPIDLTEEEKTVLAYLSIRQFMLIVPAGVFSFMVLLLFNIPFISGWAEFFVRLFFFFLINTTTVLLAFVPLETRDQYLSEYVVTKYKYLTSKKVYRS